jgi:hypothetical protein
MIFSKILIIEMQDKLLNIEIWRGISLYESSSFKHVELRNSTLLLLKTLDVIDLSLKPIIIWRLRKLWVNSSRQLFKG